MTGAAKSFRSGSVSETLGRFGFVALDSCPRDRFPSRRGSADLLRPASTGFGDDNFVQPGRSLTSGNPLDRKPALFTLTGQVRRVDGGGLHRTTTRQHETLVCRTTELLMPTCYRQELVFRIAVGRTNHTSIGYHNYLEGYKPWKIK